MEWEVEVPYNKWNMRFIYYEGLQHVTRWTRRHVPSTHTTFLGSCVIHTLSIIDNNSNTKNKDSCWSRSYNINLPQVSPRQRVSLIFSPVTTFNELERNGINGGGSLLLLFSRIPSPTTLLNQTIKFKFGNNPSQTVFRLQLLQSRVSHRPIISLSHR